MDQEIKLYGTKWCFDTKRAQRVFEKLNIPYSWIDIDKDEEAERFVKETNNGFRSVPTIIFPDGSKMVEPNSGELEEKLKTL